MFGVGAAFHWLTFGVGVDLARYDVSDVTVRTHRIRPRFLRSIDVFLLLFWWKLWFAVRLYGSRVSCVYLVVCPRRILYVEFCAQGEILDLQVLSRCFHSKLFIDVQISAVSSQAGVAVRTLFVCLASCVWMRVNVHYFYVPFLSFLRLFMTSRMRRPRRFYVNDSVCAVESILCHEWTFLSRANISFPRMSFISWRMQNCA